MQSALAVLDFSLSNYLPLKTVHLKSHSAYLQSLTAGLHALDMQYAAHHALEP